MAENENNNAEKVVKTEKKAKKDKPSLGARISKFLRDYKSELGKVVWSSPKQTLNNTVLVAVSVVVVSACIAILDFVFTKGIEYLGNII